jgi:F-type H+-transporting ATPase subunit epsilon
MIHSNLLVKIILPSKILLEQECDLVNIPGTEGVFGVLPGHSKITASIAVGVASVFYKDNEQRYFVYGGVAQVTGFTINIVTEFAAKLEEKTAINAEEHIKTLENTLSNLKSDADLLEIDIVNSTIKKYQSLLRFL